MRHAAVSISITTLTDALAFLIGAIAPLPAVGASGNNKNCLYFSQHTLAMKCPGCLRTLHMHVIFGHANQPSLLIDQLVLDWSDEYKATKEQNKGAIKFPRQCFITETCVALSTDD